MKVIKLTAENFLRLLAVEITPTGEVVKVSGRNGQGKTSTIDAIWAALDLAALGLSQPLRRGAKKAKIKLNLGDILVERTITAKGQELKVTAADGTLVSSPQKFLDAMIGELSFDPLEFGRLKPAEQYEQLRRAVNVDYDFAAAAKANEADFHRRTEINRQAKVKRAQAEGMPLGTTPGLAVDEAPLIAKINQAGEHNAQLEARRMKRQRVQTDAENAELEAARLTEEIEVLRQKIVGLGQARDAAELTAKQLRERLANAAPLPERIDVSEATAELVRAQQHNAALVQSGRRGEVEREAAELEAAADEITERMKARDDAKAQALAAAKMPVPGLTLGDGEVLLNGFPFAQASAAERLRVGMAIAMAANPKIRVIRISDGSLLDSESMRLIGEMARDNDFQVWVEVVDESKKIGIVIEDGAVAAVNP